MPKVQNYGGRNGVATVVKYVRLLCKIYVAFSGAIVAFINASPLSPTDKTKVLTWLNGAVEVCSILESSILVTYEN